MMRHRVKTEVNLLSTPAFSLPEIELVFNKNKFLSDFQRMVANQSLSNGCYETLKSDTSVAMVSCVFCDDCRYCHQCQYCVRCHHCARLTHCKDCRFCYALTNSEHCESCFNSKYLNWCRFCSDCQYCFGCVGLYKKDFHVLNQPYSRENYFKIVTYLRKELQ